MLIQTPLCSSMPHCLLMSQFYLVVAGIHTTPCLPMLQSYFVVMLGIHDSKFKRKQFTMTQCYPYFDIANSSILLYSGGGNPWLKVKVQRVLHDSMLPTLHCYQYLNVCLHLIVTDTSVFVCSVWGSMHLCLSAERSLCLDITLCLTCCSLPQCFVHASTLLSRRGELHLNL